MQTCSLCKAQSPDEAKTCMQCGADLSRLSTSAVALAGLRANPRVSTIRLIVANDACPACRAAEGEFSKDKVAGLPTRGCSHAHGCRCWYEPALTEIYP